MNFIYNSRVDFKKGDNMDFVKRNIGKWISALIVLTIGILCIVAGATMGGNDWNAAKDSLDAISLILGIILIVIGGLSLCVAIFAVIMAKKSLLAVGLLGGVIVGLGVSLVVAKYAATFIWILLTVVPFILVAVGLVIVADAVITLVRAIRAKAVNSALPAVIGGILVGVASVVIGFLCMSLGDNEPVIPSNVQLIIFGILVALYALLMIALTFVKIPGITIVVAKSEKAE